MKKIINKKKPSRKSAAEDVYPPPPPTTPTCWSNVKVIQTRTYTTCCFKDDLAILKLMVKIWFLYWDQMSRSYVGHECTRHIVQWWYKDNKSVARTQSHVRNLMNLTLRSKVNVVSRIMNVWNTAYPDDRPMCQIWYANMKAKRCYGSDTKTRTNLKIWFWDQRSTSHRDHKYMQYIVSWW